MATETLVREMIDDGQMLIEQLRKGGVDVAAAMWLKPSDEDRWSLYLASSAVEAKGIVAAYGDVLPVLRSMPNSRLGLFDIKVIGVTHPIAQDVLELNRRYQGRMPNRYRGRLLGRAIIDEAYLYPVAPAA